MRVPWLVAGLVAVMLMLAPRAFAGAGGGCCACTFCDVPTFCANDIANADQCDTFCNSGGTCQFHTLVGGSTCDEVAVCPQAAPAAPVGAPAMSPLAQLLLLLGLGGLGYATLKRRLASRH